MAATAVAGLLIGAAFGALTTSGKICFNAGLRRAAFEHDATVLRVFALAIAFQLIALPALVGLGVSLAPVGLFPLAQIVGGLAFGAGMALAGGCIAGILWKTGAGSIATAVAVAGFALGELLVRGPGKESVRALDRASAPGPEASTLDAVLGLPYAPVAVPLGVAAVALLLARRRDGLTLGLALAAVSALAWVAAGWVGTGYGLGFTGAAVGVREGLAGGSLSALGWPAWLAIGTVAGAALVARGPVRYPDAPRLARGLLGGVLMGVGANIAHGCNIGLGLAGLPTLSLGSTLAVACMTAAALAVRGLALERFPRVRGVERPEPAGW